MGWTLSVDYGTTNTTAAVRHEGRSPTAVPLGPEGTMPSATLLTSGGIEVGEAALAGRRTAPEYFVGSPKLLLGQDAVLLGDSEVEVADLVARTLSVVLDAAVRAAGGGEPDEVVLTHPQTWARPRRSALEAAWRRTGSQARVRMVSEPIAAVSWFADTDALPDDARVAVLDFGGGTCDVAVLHHTGGASAPLEITAHAGLDDLGGVTIDHVFALWVRAQVRAQGLTELDDALGEREHLTSLHALYDAVREAKHRLADWEYADVPVAADGRETTVTVTINEFNQIIAAETERARALLERSIAAAGTTPGELHGLYLTGGSSRLRWVHQMAAELLDGRPAHLAEPHLVVALGAHSATRVRVVERVDAESSRFITLRGLQALPGGTSRSLPLPPPTGLPVSSTPPRRGPAAPPVPPPPPSAAARIPGPAPARPAAGVAAPKGPPVAPPAGVPTGPPPAHLRQAGPPPPGTAPNRAGDGAAPRSGPSVAETLLAAQPALRDATTLSPELRAVLEAPAVLVALLSVPGLLDQVARHPALMTVPVSDGSDRTFTTPDDPESALLPVRLFFAGRPAWQRALDDPAWRHAFLGVQQGGPAWAHALLQRWPHLPETERARALDDPGWRLPLPPTPPWIDRAPGRLTVRVPAAAAGAGAGAGFLRPRAASPVQADLLGVLEARGAFDGGEAFRERLNAARDPRLPAHRATVALHLGGRPVDDVELYLFPGGRHRGGSGSGDRDLPAYVLLLPSRARRTTTPLLALTRDLVDAVVQVPGPPGTHIATHVVSLVLTREAGSPGVPTGGGVELSGRDPGLGVDLARTLDRPWRGR